MTVKIDITGADPSGRVFLTWAPVSATISLSSPAQAPVDVILGNAGTLGELVFDTAPSDQGQASLQLTLPADGDPVPFWIAGAFQKSSAIYGDAVLSVTEQGSGQLLGTRALMVRIRKNAQTLSAPERDRFLAALGTLNARGQGAYRLFRDMHTAVTTREMHGDVGFLPWHRAYVLDLERALQVIDPTVALPYWRFDEPAPNLFTRDFMGRSNASQVAEFRPGHALEQWQTDGQLGITRGLDFGVNDHANVIDELATMNLGDDYSGFATGDLGMEIDPHGSAHVSFSQRSPISRISTAVRDPLFFLLHANVDRLWAKWQWLKHHTSPADPGAFAEPLRNKLGHHLPDTMWPWNGLTGGDRPPTAPGGQFPETATTKAPGPTPKVEDVFDHLGVSSGAPLGYAYDDVPFELPPTLVAGGP